MKLCVAVQWGLLYWVDVYNVYMNERVINIALVVEWVGRDLRWRRSEVVKIVPVSAVGCVSAMDSSL